MLALRAMMNVLAMAALVQASLTCPGPGTPETAEDCPYAGYSRALSEAASRGEPLEAAFQTIDPYTAAAARKVGQDLYAHAREVWGSSINFDELARGEIVDPAILDQLQRWMKVPARQGRLVHAGMEHTFGYLYSTLRTPFGYKRARWVRDDIEAGFGLPRGSLGPQAASLFLNATSFAAGIAFRDDPRTLAWLHENDLGEDLAIRGFDFSKLRRTRLEEVWLSNSGRQVVLRTDFVPFPNQTSGRTNTHLLVYSVADSQLPRPSLITMFPVEASFVRMALDPKSLGENKPIVTRYNGFVDGMTNATTPLIGVRRVSGDQGPGAP